MDTTPVDYGPHGQSHSESRQERAERAAREQAIGEFQNSPASTEITKLGLTIAALTAKLDALQRRFDLLEGRGGIKVTGNIIEFLGAQAKAGDGGGSTDGDLLTLIGLLSDGSDITSNVIEVTGTDDGLYTG